MRIESDGHSRGNPRLYELIEHAPKTGKSPTVWAWPELIDYLKVAGQPVAGPWPPHQEPRPEPYSCNLSMPLRLANWQRTPLSVCAPCHGATCGGIPRRLASLAGTDNTAAERPQECGFGDFMLIGALCAMPGSVTWAKGPKEEIAVA